MDSTRSSSQSDFDIVSEGTTETVETQEESNTIAMDVTGELVCQQNKQEHSTLQARMDEPPLELETRLRRALIGHEVPIRKISAAIRHKESGWCDDSRPLVFLYINNYKQYSSTLMEQIAAHRHNGGRYGFAEFDMKNYSGMNEFCKLINVKKIDGYGNGQLYEAMAACPRAVILLQDIDEADVDVRKELLHIFNEGLMAIPHSRIIDCKEVIFVLTSSIGRENLTEHVVSLTSSLDAPQPTRNFQIDVMRPILIEKFQNNFFDRIDEIVYFLGYRFSDEIAFIQQHMQTIFEKAQKERGLTVTFDANAVVRVLHQEDEVPTIPYFKKLVDHRIGSHLALAEQRGLIYPGCKVYIGVQRDAKDLVPNDADCTKTDGNEERKGKEAEQPQALLFRVTTPQGEQKDLNLFQNKFA